MDLFWVQRSVAGSYKKSVALDLQIWLGFEPGIEGIARALLVFSVLPTVIALVWYFERARWHRVLRSLRYAD